MEKLSKGFLWKQRIGFGISDYACNLAYLMVNTYLLIFYTDVAGIPAGAAAFMFLVTKFIDGITDYIVGSLVDRTNTKIGRSRPWMLAGAPVLAIGMVLVFTTPEWSSTGKLVWAYLTYIIFSFGYTMVNIPMGSILPTLSADSRERTKIVTSRTIFSSLGSLTSASMALFLISRLGHGNMAEGYRNTNVVFGIMVIIILFISVFSIKEINPAPKVTEKANIFKDLAELGRNKPYMLILGYTYTMFVGTLGMYASIAYYFKYVVGNEMLTSVAVTIITIVPIFAMLVSAALNQKIGKRDISIIGCILTIIGYAIMGFGAGKMPVLYTGIVIMAVGGGFRSNMFFSMGADIVDYGQWKFGKSLAGTQTAVRGFVNKLASASASAIVAGLLAWGAYDGTAAVQSTQANTAITIAFIAVPIVCAVVSIVILLFYDLDKNYAQIKKDLGVRRIEKETAKQNCGQTGVMSNEEVIYD